MSIERPNPGGVSERRLSLQTIAASAILLAVFFLIWALSTELIGQRWLPSPLQIAIQYLRTFAHSPLVEAQGGGNHGVFPHALATACRFFVSTAVGLFVAFIAASLATYFRPFHFVLSAALLPWQTIPPLLLLPIIIVIAGVTSKAIFAAASIYTFVSFTPYVIAAFFAVKPQYLDLAALSGADSFWSYWHVRVPAALPRLLGPAMLVSGFCLGILAILEYIAAPSGLGRVMKIAISYNAIDLLIVALLWTLLIGIAMDVLIRVSLARALRWTKH